MLAFLLTASLAVEGDAIAQSATRKAAARKPKATSGGKAPSKFSPAEEARALQNRALADQFIGANIKGALESLELAIGLCGPDQCSPRLRSELRRDRAFILLVGNRDKDGAFQALKEAVRVDADITTDGGPRNPEFDDLLKKAKAKTDSAYDVVSDSESAVGDFAHTPFPEQSVNTPLPIYAEYAGKARPSHVVVRFKKPGSADWDTFELRRYLRGFGGLLPCEQVVEGEIKYVFEGLDDEGNVVATGGDRRKPYVVTVSKRIPQLTPHLPEKPAPKQCTEEGACDPGMPGCKFGQGKERLDGEQCFADDECKNHRCEGGVCKPQKAPYSRWWVGLGVSFDFMFVPTSRAACTISTSTGLPVDPAGYYCIADGRDYPNRDDKAEQRRIDKDNLNAVEAGAALGNLRIKASADYAVSPNVLLGTRLGLVLNQYPGTAARNTGITFAPVHLEARATYVIGKEPLAKPGLSQYLFGGLGLSQFDAMVDTTVLETGNKTPRPVQAWHIVSGFFTTVGLGVRYAFTPSQALMVAPQFTLLFGGTGTTFLMAPELAYQLGF